MMRASGALAAALGAALVACNPAPDVLGTASDVVAVTVEACNGFDDDGNGIVDDLDVHRDGLCDCLRIGVIGYPGTYGTIDNLRAWLHARAVPTTLLGSQVLTPELLMGLDILLVQDVRDGVADGTTGQEGTGKGIGRAFSDAEVQALKAWVDAGGGLMTLSGFSRNAGEVTNVNRLLQPFGLGYGSSVILSGGTTPIPVTHWDGAHPIASGITAVGANAGFPVSGGTLVAWEPAPGASDVGRALVSGQGHVFAWADEWIEYDSEWTNPASQTQRLWLNAMRWLTVAGYCQVPLPY